MTRVAGEILIHRPVEEVFDFVADERHEPRYNPRMLAAELISDEPIGLGSRFRAELKAMHRRIPMTIEFTEFDRPRRLGSATHSSTMDTVGALTFERAGDGTVMRWSWDVRPRGVLRLIPAVVASLGRRQEQSIWASLKRLLESHAQLRIAPRAVAAAQPGPARHVPPPLSRRAEAGIWGACWVMLIGIGFSFVLGGGSACGWRGRCEAVAAHYLRERRVVWRPAGRRG